MSNDCESLISELSVSKMLNIKLRTLQSWRGQGKSPPYIKIGEKLIRYRTSDVYRWLDEQTLKVQNLNRT